MSGAAPVGSAIVTPGPFNKQGMPRRDGFTEVDGSLTPVAYRFLVSMFNELSRLGEQVTTLSGEIAALRASQGDVTP